MQSWKVADIQEFAALAAKTAKLGIRLVLLAMPDRALEMAVAMDAGELKSVESGRSNWRAEPVPPWGSDAIYFRLSENIAVAENPSAVTAIAAATCGYGRMVERLCVPSLSVDVALSAPVQLQAEYAPTPDVFYNHLGIPAAFAQGRRAAVETFLSLIDGAKRQATEVEDTRVDSNITQGEMEFMYWVGLLQHGPSGTWKVPPMYLRSIGGGAK